MPSIIAMQRALARKALEKPEHRFGSLYGLVRDYEWLYVSLDQILSNDGAGTPGIDGITKEHLKSEEARIALVKEVAQQLKDGTYRPRPVKRIYIPKQNGNLRPLGIPTIADRMVQENLRMVLEPIWESHFLPCSYGFRPGRRTMDAISQIWILTRNSHKYFWVVEGDIKGCFDTIPHAKLLETIEEKIADTKLLNLIKRMLAAGYVEEGRTHTPNAGTPQGGVVSPLLANIYLHKMDEIWQNKYNTGSESTRYNRRKRGEGLVQFIRYADDFLVLTNGVREQAESLKEEFGQILKGMGLELSTEKTLVTHVNDGFNFLGFHCQRKEAARLRSQGKTYRLYVEPTEKSCQRFKEKIKGLLETTNEDVPNKIRAVNRVTRGWANYYKYVQSYRTKVSLDWWIWQTVYTWLSRKHGGKIGKRELRNLYERRDRQGWLNWESHGISVLKMGRDVRIERYKRKKAEHPYLTEYASLEIQDEGPLNAGEWNGSSTQNRYAAERLQRIKDVGYKCEKCGSGPLPLNKLHAHHPRGKETKETEREIEVLCINCHKETPSYGVRKYQERAGEPDALKGASPVRGGARKS